MNSKLVCSFMATILIALGLSACGGSSGPTAPAQDVGTLMQVLVPSAALGTSRPTNIYVPYGYNTQTKYPVLYIYHGGSGTQDSWMPYMGMNFRADQLIREKKMTPLIIVAPQMLREGYAAGAEETFVYKELIEYVDAHYSTNATRENRFIGGLSMGGFIALHNAFMHTEVFSKVGGHSPYLYPIPGVTDTLENPIVTADTKDLTMLKVYLDAGVSDHFNLVPTNKTLFDILQSKGAPSENHVGPGGHDTFYWSSNIDNYLIFYAGK